jgi:predicted RNase H-like HicB family nuclease
MSSITVELIPDPDLGGFTARIWDIPAYGEGETEDEAIADLKEAIRGYIEAFGLEDALARLSKPGIRQLDWDLAELAHGYRDSGSQCLAETRRALVQPASTCQYFLVSPGREDL